MASGGFGWELSQEYPFNAGVQGSILGPILFLPHINDLPDAVICNIGIYAENAALYSKCDQAYDLWQQLELGSELESDLWDTGLGQEVACFQCWKNSTSFVWPV